MMIDSSIPASCMACLLISLREAELLWGPSSGKISKILEHPWRQNSAYSRSWHSILVSSTMQGVIHFQFLTMCEQLIRSPQSCIFKLASGLTFLFILYCRFLRAFLHLLWFSLPQVCSGVMACRPCKMHISTLSYHKIFSLFCKDWEFILLLRSPLHRGDWASLWQKCMLFYRLLLALLWPCKDGTCHPQSWRGAKAFNRSKRALAPKR